MKRAFERTAWRWLVAASVLFLCSAQASAWTSSSNAFGVTIRVEGEGWGSAEREEIETLLYAVADELVDGPAPVFARPIVVTQGGLAPVTFFASGPEGEHRIRLSARGRAWAQYAYQFGHELCHVMANPAAHADDPGRKRHQWFEEALCEAAGLYVLRSMAVRWRDEAPYAPWQDYAPVLARYAAGLLAEPHRQLPDGASAAQWLRSRLHALSANPYLRGDNEVLANLLLARFEDAPEHWSALYALNRDVAPVGLDGYIRRWEEAAPREHRPFIADLADLLGVDGDVEMAATTPPPLAARAVRMRAY